ncbi:MAG: hypothetical protein Q9184_007063, partial [Pyrenodesmia sp. 2 TL-2023]
MGGIEILIRKRTDFTSAAALKRFLNPLLEPFGIVNPEIRLTKTKNHALLTTHKHRQGSNFLKHFKRFRLGFLPSWHYHGEQLTIVLSDHEPNEFLIRVLQREEKIRLINGHENSEQTGTALSLSPAPLTPRGFSISSLACGNWEYVGPDPYFHPYYIAFIDATIVFGDRYIVLTYTTVAEDTSVELLNYPPPDDSQGSDGDTLYHRLLFPYSAMTSVALDHERDHALVCTFTEAPKMWINRLRGIGLKGLPMQVATSCQVYHFRLADPLDFPRLLHLEHEGVFPQSSVGPVPAVELGESFLDQVAQLKASLNDPKHDFTFPLKFQIQKLAQNGYLTPRAVLALINYISFMQQKHGATSTIAALRRLFQQLPYAGPPTKATELDLRATIDLLKRNIESLAEEQLYQSSLLDLSLECMTIHRAEVTPTGVYLAGPDPEAGNRVLRKWSAYSDCFLRVTFMDEDGEGYFFDRNFSNRVIFHDRFTGILNDGIEVAGRVFKFLGFSHSSLRARTCWFLAPFVHEGTQVDADLILAQLGDFSHIRSPAKCAARIGQAFTETPSTIHIDPACVSEMDDVERNGRVFSDGVGTCSLSIIEKLQDTQKSSTISPTIFQIRYAGAKGVISLDNRLEGDVLRLRPSMVKYRGSKDSNIEICGVASRMLPLVLNRQLIKILEDLGIPNRALEDLQERAINELRGSVSSVTNAAALLERHD